MLQDRDQTKRLLLFYLFIRKPYIVTRRLEIDIPLFEFNTQATIRRTVQAVDDTGRQ